MNILAIDPGSTSTKIGVYHNGLTSKANLEHPRPEIERFARIGDQFGYRLECIDAYLAREGHADLAFDAVVGRGGLLRPVAGGVYLVDDILEQDLKCGVCGEHASNLGGLLARSIADRHGVPAFVVDPPVLDELCPVARLTGLAGIERKSLFHALNQKAAARDVARELGRTYDSLNLIVAHMGGGITVGAHRRGRVIDVNNGLNGDGPFAPERTGALPVIGVLQQLEDGVYTIPELKSLIAGRGGIYSYLGTVDLRQVEKMKSEGDEQASLVFNAMVYQIAKEIGGLAAALDGDVDGIVLTGGLAKSDQLVAAIERKVRFLAPVYLRPGEFEIEALIAGARRVLEKSEELCIYRGEHHENRS